MSMLNSVTRGKIKTPDFICLYGPDGVGKSTFGSQAPNPIFLGTEKGTANLNVSRFPSPENLEQCNQAVDELMSEKHDYKTLVLDSVDWMEPLILDWICRDSGVQHVEQAYGGYGKWVAANTKQWHLFLNKLSKLRDQKGMNIIILGHSQVKSFANPQTNTTYDRYQLKLQEKASALVREIVDCVLFANFEVFTKTDSKSVKSKAFGEGTRRLYTEHRPSYDAKNRYQLPSELPFSWADYVQAKERGSSNGSEQILSQIVELTKQIADEKTRTIVMNQVEKAGQDTGNLSVILNRLRTLLSA